MDFKHENAISLKNYGIDQSLIDKFIPFYGVGPFKANDALNRNPVTLSKDQFDTINSLVLKFWTQKFNKLPLRIRKSKQVIF